MNLVFPSKSSKPESARQAEIPETPTARRVGSRAVRATGYVRRLASLILLIWGLAGVCLTIWALSDNPFLRPYVELAAADAKLRIEAAIAKRVTVDWLSPRIERALRDQDLQDLELLRALAQDHAVVLPAGLQQRVDTELSRNDGAFGQISACGRCMTDFSACPSFGMASACHVPFELSPAGDVAALLRQGKAGLSGQEVDEVEAALAAIGLAATASAVISAGGAAPVKLSASMLRMARRSNSLSPGMQRALLDAASDASPARRLMPVIDDLSTLVRETSVAEALPLLRQAENAGDLRRIARVSKVTGKDTSRSLRVLGKDDAFRLLHRISDKALAAIGLIAFTLTQIAALLVAILKLVLRQIVKPRRSARHA